jgi:ribosomal protein S18 acetylase RimI-like enzyme
MTALEVRALVPSDLSDWLTFFDGAAFADNQEWSLCYCRAYLFRGEDWDAACKAGENRAPMCEAIAAGQVDGMLAWMDGRVVGWLHMGPKSRFPPLATEEEGVAAIVCLIVAADVRRRGVARALLRGALDTLQQRGCRSVEAWPRQEEVDAPAMELFHGPRALYLAEGFVPVGQRRHLTVMRRTFES